MMVKTGGRLLWHFKGFPDFTVEILKTHHSDDAVILEVRMKGTHQGEWAGLKPMGKTMY